MRSWATPAGQVVLALALACSGKSPPGASATAATARRLTHPACALSGQLAASDFVPKSPRAEVPNTLFDDPTKVPIRGFLLSLSPVVLDTYSAHRPAGVAGSLLSLELGTAQLDGLAFGDFVEVDVQEAQGIGYAGAIRKVPPRGIDRVGLLAIYRRAGRMDLIVFHDGSVRLGKQLVGSLSASDAERLARSFDDESTRGAAQVPLRSGDAIGLACFRYQSMAADAVPAAREVLEEIAARYESSFKYRLQYWEKQTANILDWPIADTRLAEVMARQSERVHWRREQPDRALQQVPRGFFEQLPIALAKTPPHTFVRDDGRLYVVRRQRGQYKGAPPIEALSMLSVTECSLSPTRGGCRLWPREHDIDLAAAPEVGHALSRARAEELGLSMEPFRMRQRLVGVVVQNGQVYSGLLLKRSLPNEKPQWDLDYGERVELIDWPEDAPPLERFRALKSAAIEAVQRHGDYSSPLYQPVSPSLSEWLADPGGVVYVTQGGRVYQVRGGCKQSNHLCRAGTYYGVRPKALRTLDWPAFAVAPAAVPRVRVPVDPDNHAKHERFYDHLYDSDYDGFVYRGVLYLRFRLERRPDTARGR